MVGNTCAQGNWEEAEQLLQDAYEKDAKNADTLANLVVAGLHLGKPTSRYAKCGRRCPLPTSLHHASLSLAACVPSAVDCSGSCSGGAGSMPSVWVKH